MAQGQLREAVARPDPGRVTFCQMVPHGQSPVPRVLPGSPTGKTHKPDEFLQGLDEAEAT